MVRRFEYSLWHSKSMTLSPLQSFHHLLHSVFWVLGVGTDESMRTGLHNSAYFWLVVTFCSGLHLFWDYLLTARWCYAILPGLNPIFAEWFYRKFPRICDRNLCKKATPHLKSKNLMRNCLDQCNCKMKEIFNSLESK